MPDLNESWTEIYKFISVDWQTVKPLADGCCLFVFYKKIYMLEVDKALKK